MYASMAAQLHLPRDLHDVLLPLRRKGVCLYEVGVAGEERLRAMSGGGVGLLVLRMTATGKVCGRHMKRLMMSVVRHVAAVHAAATPEGAQLADMLLWKLPAVLEDRKRAFKLASVGAGMRRLDSQAVLGCCYASGRGVAKNEAKGLELGKESAAAGCCMGQFVVGKCFFHGWGVAQNYDEAARLYRLAAEQGHANAQFHLGLMFGVGHGVAQDYAEAARLYRLAADQGDIISHINLHMMCNAGVGMMKDGAQADHHYRMAAAEIEPEDINQLMRTCNNPLAHIIRYGHPRPRDASCFFLQQ
jgi:hypothetical protein